MTLRCFGTFTGWLSLGLACVALLLDCGSAVAPATAAEPQSHYVLVQNVLEKHIIPHMNEFHHTAAGLPELVSRVCETGDDATREELGGQFRKVVDAWAGIWYLRFGPLEQSSQRDRFAFWPDPRGVMQRQLRQTLANKDAAVIAPGGLAKQSAAIQGLPALEVLLTDKETPLAPGEAAQYRCALASAIAQNLDDIARAIADGWTKEGGWKDKMLRPGSDNDTYKEPAEAANEIMKSLLTGLQLTGDVLVKPRLDAKFSGGAFEKANASKDFYRHTVASLDEMYEVSGIESYLPEDKDWARNWAGGTWRAIKASDGTGGTAQGVAKADAPPLKELMSRISGMRQLLSKEMIPAAGLTVGFNELDGD